MPSGKEPPHDQPSAGIAALAQRTVAPPGSNDPREPVMPAPRVIADVSSYEQMLAALRDRVNELQVNGERFDEYCGLPKGYLSKLIGIKPIRRLGMTSFAPVLAGLGLRLLVIEDQEATERLKNCLPPRNQSYVRSVAVHTNLTTRFLRKIGAKGGENSRKYLGKRLVKQLARKAAAARWQKATS